MLLLILKIVLNFLTSLLDSPALDKGFGDRTIRNRAYRPLLQGNDYCCSRGSGCFPYLNRFRSAEGRYKERNGLREAANHLSDKDEENLRDCLNLDHEPIVVISGCKSNTDSEWTTYLLLEIMEAMRRVINKTTVLTAHLCGEVNEMDKGQDVVILDLLAQFIESQNDKLDGIHICREDNLEEKRFYTIPTDAKGLWDLFIKCVEQAKVQNLVIMLDQVDSMHKKLVGSGSEGGLEGFVTDLESFCEKLRQREVKVKVVVTSRSPDATRSFNRAKNSKIIEFC